MPRLGWLIPLISLLLVTVNAQQVCDPLRWGNASSWKGTFTVNGNASGTVPPTSCSVTTETTTESITGSPTLQGAYPNWAGTMNAIPSVNETDTTTYSACPPPQAPSCTNTIVGNGEAAGSDVIFLYIDAQSCRYGILPTPFANGTVTGCDGSVAQAPLPWGPLFGPDGSIVIGLPANTPTFGAGVIDLPTTGVDLSYTVPTYTSPPFLTPTTWNINWKLSPKCQVTLPNKFLQNAGNWGGDPYGGNPAKTVGALGCALTSLTMALQYAWVTSDPNVPIIPLLIDPGALNMTMTDQGDFDGSAVSYDRTARFFGFKFDDLGGVTGSLDNPTLAKQKLDYALCSKTPHPVIVGVKITSSGGTNSPGHFVLVTGRDEDGHYTIVDPSGVGKTLDDYANEFSTRGFVKDPPGDISALDIDTGDNITLLVTDAVGNQTGTDPTSGNLLQQIPGSAYFIDRVDDDITGEVDTHPAHMVLIPTPKPGTFTITAQGVNSGPYAISIRGFSQDGSSQPPITFNGNATPGSATTYSINYVSAPGTTSVVNFSAFAAKAEITHRGFEVHGSFTLGTGSAGISPDTQPVTLTLGSFTTTIPAGSFKRHHNGHYALEGTINGVRLEFEITPIGGNGFRFSIEAHDVNLSSVTSPLILKLAIGNDGGTTQVTQED